MANIIEIIHVLFCWSAMSVGQPPTHPPIINMHSDRAYSIAKMAGWEYLTGRQD